MLKRYLLLFSVIALVTSGLESCFIFKGKNRCDSCPGLVKQKRTKRHTKGSI
jgi:hypothetical protein